MQSPIRHFFNATSSTWLAWILPWSFDGWYFRDAAGQSLPQMSEMYLRYSSLNPHKPSGGWSPDSLVYQSTWSSGWSPQVLLGPSQHGLVPRLLKWCVLYRFGLLAPWFIMEVIGLPSSLVYTEVVGLLTPWSIKVPGFLVLFGPSQNGLVSRLLN